MGVTATATVTAACGNDRNCQSSMRERNDSGMRDKHCFAHVAYHILFCFVSNSDGERNMRRPHRPIDPDMRRTTDMRSGSSSDSGSASGSGSPETSLGKLGARWAPKPIGAHLADRAWWGHMGPMVSQEPWHSNRALGPASCLGPFKGPIVCKGPWPVRYVGLIIGPSTAGVQVFHCGVLVNI
jgi:hypothetical protein